MSDKPAEGEDGGLDVGDNEENADQLTNFDKDKEDGGMLDQMDMGDDMGDSVRALTLKDDIDYEDAR
jgi:hypothetical protein